MCPTPQYHLKYKMKVMCFRKQLNLNNSLLFWKMNCLPWVSIGHLLNLASSHWFCLPVEKQLHFLSCWFVLIKLLSDIKHKIKEDEFCLFILDVFWSTFDFCFPLLGPGSPGVTFLVAGLPVPSLGQPDTVRCMEVTWLPGPSLPPKYCRVFGITQTKISLLDQK